MNFFESSIINILDGNIKTVSQFIEKSNGIFIKEIYDVLKKIVKGDLSVNTIKKRNAKKLFCEFHQANDNEIYRDALSYINYFPVPHILDSDWRFAKETTKYLCELVKSYFNGKKTI